MTALSAIDLFGLAAGILGGMSFAPQLYQTIRDDHAGDVSPMTLAMVVVSASMWIAWGAWKAEPVVMLVNAINATMVACVLAYRLKDHRDIRMSKVHTPKP